MNIRTIFRGCGSIFFSPAELKLYKREITRLLLGGRFFCEQSTKKEVVLQTATYGRETDAGTHNKQFPCVHVKQKNEWLSLENEPNPSCDRVSHSTEAIHSSWFLPIPSLVLTT